MTIFVKKLEINNIINEESEFFSNFTNTFNNPTHEIYRLEQIDFLIKIVWKRYALVFFLKEFFLYTTLFITGLTLILNFYTN